MPRQFLPFVISILAMLCLAATGQSQNTNPLVTWHWHMHQPIYWNDQLRTGAVDRYEYAWESIQQKDSGSASPENDLREIFGKEDRVAAYQYRPKDSLAALLNLPSAGMSASFSGALMENVNSLGDAGQLGYAGDWNTHWATANSWKTSGNKPRMDMVNFSFHHALLALHNDETIYMELRLQQEKAKQEFGASSISRGIFPTEMCFSTRLIPVLKSLGIEWAIVSGEHIARACPDFPLVIGSGGVNTDLPNRADQINPNGINFIRTQISRGCAPVNANPLSYQPAYVKYIDPATGAETKIIAVPADQAYGWEDGYGCLGAGFLSDLSAHNNSAQPSLVLLAHDGDNAFGGGFSYYHECVPNLANAANNQGNPVTTVEQYLAEFPPNPNNIIHVEDGGWVNADSDFGSPMYINWNYPPLNAQGQVDPENGWHEKMREFAIFTATLNRVLTAQQISGHSPDFAAILQPGANTHAVDRAWHYYLGSLDSGNVYFGAPLDLEIKGTIGCNEAVEHADPIIGNGSDDETAPTIWVPQRHPYNPGSRNFGVQYGYKEYFDDGDFHIYTFIADVSSPATAVLKYRIDNDGKNPLASNENETYAGGSEVGEWVSLPMTRRAFPKGNIYNKPELNYFELPTYVADYYWVEVEGLRDTLIDYYVEATDTKGNVARSAIQHVYIGDGSGSSGGGGDESVVTVAPDPPVQGQPVTITYNADGRPLDGAAQVYLHYGKNNWATVHAPDVSLTSTNADEWQITVPVDADAAQIDFVFNNGQGAWDNNNGQDWHFVTTEIETSPTIALSTNSIEVSCHVGQNPAAQTFTVVNGGGSTLEYTIASNVDWMQPSPAFGASTGEADTINIGFEADELAAGEYDGVLTIAAAGAPNSPLTVAVKLVITELPISDFTAPAPEDLIFYHVMIDRFNNGDPSNDNANPRTSKQAGNPSGFHGGDLEGVRQKLDYIKGLGANAIWLSPFLENVNNYHGYATYNWYNVEPNFGTIDDLRRLVSEANELGIAVYYDLVAGHCGDLINSNNSGYPGYLAPPSQYTLRWRGSLQYPPPFDSLSYFHAHGNIGNFSAPEQELGELFGLDDLKTESTYVREEMLKIWEYWTRETGVSGFRVDTVKHVDLGFWQTFLPAIRDEAEELGRGNFFIFGEIYGADDNYMREYVGTLEGSPYKFDSALDFQYYYTAESVFARADAAPSNMVNRLLSRNASLGDHHLRMPNFFDNHDVRRFMAVAGDRPGAGLSERRKRLEQALVFLFAAPGPPIVYYGTEQEFDGANDPFNREDMFDGEFESGPSAGDNFDTESSMYQLVRLLAAARAQNSPLRRGDLVPRFAETNGPGGISITRTHAGETAVIVMNTATESRTIPGFTEPALANTVLINVLNPEENLTIPGSGAFPTRQLAAQESELWVIDTNFSVPPAVVAFTPADGENNVATDLAAITIEFNMAMNTTATEAAIGIVPNVNYTISWSGDSREVTLHLEEALLAASTYTVSVGAAATDLNGTPIVAKSATWNTEHVDTGLPPLPTAVGPIRPTSLSIIIDGEANEWPNPTSIAENSGSVIAADSYLWNDAAGDDTGPGTYTYPTNSVFSGSDADLDYFQFAYDDEWLYFILRSGPQNPEAFFFTPYHGVALDVQGNSTSRAIGHDQGSGALGVAELEIRADAAMDYEIVFTGPLGATLFDVEGNALQSPEFDFSPATGVIEMRVSRASVGLDEPLNNRRINLVVYTGLESFGSMREVAATAAEWNPGGGIAEASDPDVFDLAGAPNVDQQFDLAGYDENSRSTVVHSIIGLLLDETAGDDFHGWMFRE